MFCINVLLKGVISYQYDFYLSKCSQVNKSRFVRNLKELMKFGFNLKLGLKLTEKIIKFGSIVVAVEYQKNFFFEKYELTDIGFEPG